MISGKAAAVEPSVIYTWKSKVMNDVAGYSLKDVFNADETGLYFKQLPQKLLTMPGEACNSVSIQFTGSASRGIMLMWKMTTSFA
ncbi:Tigger transposable element-derived protein [Trichinella spiralis]|uniref:Tigger transposable element-derived protein n=1 Tax=Trichinella spiralis TaxID=6334 RepID=A0ABR3KEN8_TRISP